MRSNTKRKTIRTNKLVKLINESSGYPIDEIEDILMHLFAHTRLHILQGNAVQYSCLGELFFVERPDKVRTTKKHGIIVRQDPIFKENMKSLKEGKIVLEEVSEDQYRIRRLKSEEESNE